MSNGANILKDRPMPLEGVRVVEYGVFHAGPGASAILGDLGAEVIKIEDGKGDPERYWTSAGGVDFTMPNGEGLMFQISNRNKKGIYLDIRKEKGRLIFHRLIKSADVFLTNLRKSTKARLGIDYRTISRINPRIIHANVSAYGPEGPESDLGAFDPMAQGRSGLMFITALFFRERHGVGQEVHSSLFSAALWFQYTNMMMNGCMSIDQIPSERSQNSPLRNSFRCKDGNWIVGTHHGEKHWALFCEATAQTAILNDSRFSSEASRKANCQELIELFDRAFVTKTRDEWMEIFRAHGLMFCPVQEIHEVFTDLQALKNDYVVDFNHPALGKVNILGYPIHFGSARAGTRSVAPALGEHTKPIMKQLGFTDEEIQELKNEGVIAG